MASSFAEMNNPNKFCLKRNDFGEKIRSLFGDLREDREYTDITLACEDEHIDVHKVILAHSSPFFKRIISKTKNSSPLIYMRGMKARELVYVLDFIYKGEVDVFEDDLPGFLALAEELELQGLAGGQNTWEETGEPSKEPLQLQGPEQFNTINESAAVGSMKTEMFSPAEKKHNPILIEYPARPAATKQSVMYGEHVAEKIESMMDYGDGRWTCNVCGLSKKAKSHIKEHVETHIEGIAYPCDPCGRTFKTSHSLRTHLSKCAACK